MTAGRQRRVKAILPSPAEALRIERARAQRQKWEARFALSILALGLPQPEREYRFHPQRKWRFDFAWPKLKIAFEVDGGLKLGRHTTPKGFKGDCEKCNEAMLLGWAVYRMTGEDVKNGEAIKLLCRVLTKREETRDER